MTEDIYLGHWILPTDLTFTLVSELPSQLRQSLSFEEGDYVLTRQESRVWSKVIDSEFVDLLTKFRQASTIVEAVLSYCQEKKLQPESVLNEVFPLLNRLISEEFLLPETHSHLQGNISSPSLPLGAVFDDCHIVELVQRLEDNEIYKVQQNDGTFAALKLGCEAKVGQQDEMVREAYFLKYLDGGVAPKLLSSGSYENRSYVLSEWCHGVAISAIAENLRDRNTATLLRLCEDLLWTYASLHKRKVIHSDVHPGNIIVDDDLHVKLIDFAFARVDERDHMFGSTPRAGVSFYFEPEHAVQLLNSTFDVKASMSGEQFALAAMIYHLLTGVHYLPFELEKIAMLKQIVEHHPKPLPQNLKTSCPLLEAILLRALSKEPEERFETVAEFAQQFSEAIDGFSPTAPSPLPGSIFNLTSSRIDTFLTSVLDRFTLDSSIANTKPLDAPMSSAINGAAGIAWALYRIACIRGDAELLSTADLWCQRAIKHLDHPAAFYNVALKLTPDTLGHISFYHTASGVYLTQALISQARGDTITLVAAVRSFIAAVSHPARNIDVTLGRSSVLIGSSLLLDSALCLGETERQALIACGNEALVDVWQVMNDLPEIGRAHTFPFLGIAHGWAGFLYASLKWCRSANQVLPTDLEQRLCELADCGESMNNGLAWRRVITSHEPTAGDNYWTGWCNGTAGLVFLWTIAYQTLEDSKYLELAELAAEHSYFTTTTSPGLCCGNAGQAYALLNLYKHSKDSDLLKRATALTASAASSNAIPKMMRDSLFNGELGIAVLAADLRDPSNSGMPLFER